ncbi:EAL domain-containing protein [Sulfurimonas sp. HSL1-6]|uniref:EAL domain-containing protein n=1 Tax=Thiomicrolovo immobilis TaxID=3131935 RepID=UPI0031F8E675
MQTVFHIFILIFLTLNPLSAEPVINVTSSGKQYDLSDSVLLCMDHLNMLNVDMFLEGGSPAICNTVDKHQLPFGYVDDTIWLRSTLKNTSHTENAWIVDLENPLLDYVDLYVIENKKVIAHFSSGDKRPFASRPLSSLTFRFPITLLPEKTTTLVWKIHSQSAIDLPITINDPDALQDADQRRFLFYGIFYGILIILSLYNFIFFLIFRRAIYLYYVGFIVFYTMMQLSFDGFTPMLLFPDHPWLYNEGVPFFVDLTILSAILFGQRFLETELYTPKLHSVLNVIIIINLVPMIMSFFDIYYLTVKLTTLLAAITPVILLSAGFAIQKHNKRRARFYLGAWSLFFAGSTLLALHKFGLLPSTWFILHSQQFGVLLKIIVLSYALGDQLQSLLYIDQLTGIGNRHSLQRIFASSMSYAKKDKLPFAVLSIDIDDFKNINDSMTHKVGDQLLMQLSARLKAHLRRFDTILRMGQDEFLIILERIQSTESLTHIVDQLLVQIRKPFNLDNHIIHITASVGIALYPNDGDDYDTLMKNSDTALHKAKELGKNRFYFFNPVLDNMAIERLKLHNDLFEALDNNEFFLLFQPKISATDNSLAGVEVLLRWRHPKRGILTPDTFIGIAEQNGLILRITHWVLEESCKALKQWQHIGWDGIFAAVNVTAVDINDTYFIRDLLDLFSEYNLNPDLLELELTERIIVESSTDNIETIKALCDAGIKIAIDDFGTGYSTFTYLQSFQVDTIKIDKSFIDEIEFNAKTAVIVKTMTELGHALGMKVVIEGVEKEGQVQLLKRMKCDIFQGYYFDKPMTAGALVAKYFVRDQIKKG